MKAKADQRGGAGRGQGRKPLEAGNPIFSVSQTDVIIYGDDLTDYLRHEFHEFGRDGSGALPERTIRFWTAMLDPDDL